MTLKLTLEYDGSKYSGWQTQVNARTVQGELQRAADDLFRTETDIQGAGRTDAGVHALGQVAHLKVRGARKMAAAQVLRELNDRLPSSVAIVACEDAPADFHARHDAVSRTYFYQYATRKMALAKRYVWWIKDSLDVSNMRTAAAIIPGRHDFALFRAKDPSRPDESTIVVVDAAEVVVDGEMIVFRIEASHFLWKMVRRLAGVLAKVGLGEVSMDQFRGLIEGRKAAGVDIAASTAPASGLFLESVKY